jgi:ABC-type multidrug transport system ATPase subunit
MIEVDDVRIVRGKRTVVAAATLSVGPGQALALLGRGGAGKTSLLEAMATLVPLDHGEILVAGDSVRSAAQRARMRIGYTPALPALWPRARADEWLELFAREAGLQGKPLREAIAAALALADVAAGAAIDTLPAGRAKRLLIGRALLHAPPVLLVDDPFGGLDHHERNAVERLVCDLCAAGRTVVAAIDEACPSCFTHLAIVAAGTVRACGPADLSVFADRSRPWRYRLECPAAAVEATAVLRRVGAESRVVDADTVECRHASDRLAFSDLVAAVVRAGIPVEAAGFFPHWTVQLLDDADETPAE